MRTAPFAALLALLAGCGGCDDEPGPHEPPRPTGTGPNVLLITVDTLRRDHLGCYGHGRDTTPRIDAFAADAVRYERAFCQASWTCPSIASLMTSLYPSRVDVIDEYSAVHDEEFTLAEALRAAGWTTWGVTSHSFCSSLQNFDQGFDVFDESNIQGHAAVTSEALTATATALLDRPRERPFFLWVHYFDPHFAYREHKGFTFERTGDYAGPIRPGMEFDAIRSLEGELTPADLAELRRIYDSEVRFTDHHIGALLDALAGRGLLEKTLVVFTTDHGEAFGEHGRVGHGHGLGSELIAAPLIIRYPGGEPDTVTAPAMLLDVYPSVLAACGLAPPPVLTGRDLRQPVPLGEFRRVFAENSQGQVTRVVIAGQHKLVRDMLAKRSRLYDLAADPGEERDIAAERPELVASLEAELLRWLQANTPTERRSVRIEIPDGELERLRAMGYLEGARRK